MNRNGIEEFGPYQDSLVLFDHVVGDMAILQKDSRCYRLIGQQVGSADSICANMDEGFGRSSRTEFIRFLDFARGSARETLGRYKRLKHWLPADVIETRVILADRIIARLTKSIITLRANNPTPDTRHPTPDMPKVDRVREPAAAYGPAGGNMVDEITKEELALLLQAR